MLAFGFGSAVKSVALIGATLAFGQCVKLK